MDGKKNEVALAPDRTREVVRANLGRIRLISAAGPLLTAPAACGRVLRLLGNRREWGLPPPLLLLAAHDDREERDAHAFAAGPARLLARPLVVRQDRHSQSVGTALKAFREHLDPGAGDFDVKRQCLFLTRRGGKGRPEFISPFTGGGGTTCGTWTRRVARAADGTPVKGCVKAAVAVGFCPVECPYCYLNMWQTNAMDVALNWEDLAAELRTDAWRGYPYPVNFGETSGLVEYDEWLAGPGGEGSVVQFVIDACAAAGVTPFFLTKVRYPRYLRFRGKVQAGVSLMPEAVRRWMAPHGSPADELLSGLAWAAGAGACDPVVRLTVIWGQRESYPALLEECREHLGAVGWRLTLDILRFTPATASLIAGRYPQAAEVFAEEIAPGAGLGLKEIARAARGGDEHVKKVRPPRERQAEIYAWFRQGLDRLGCGGVLVTPARATRRNCCLWCARGRSAPCPVPATG